MRMAQCWVLWTLIILIRVTDLHMLRGSNYFSNEIKDDKKVATLLTVLGTKAYSLLRNIIAPSKPAEKTYKQLVDTMKSYVDPKPIVIAKHFRFHR